MLDSSTTALLHQTLLGDAWANAAVAVALFGDDRHYIAANGAFCRLTGYDRDEITSLVAGRDLAADETTEKVFEEVVSNPATRGKATMRRKDGTLVAVEFWVVETTAAGLPYFIVLLWPTDT